VLKTHNVFRRMTRASSHEPPTRSRACARELVFDGPAKHGDGFFCGTSPLAHLSHNVFGTGDPKTCEELSKIPDNDEALSAWHVLTPYESLEPCQKARNQLVSDAHQPWPAECIATDDPRLKP
jgi:hypothetical protein